MPKENMNNQNITILGTNSGNTDDFSEFFEEDFLAEYQPDDDTDVGDLGISAIDELSELLETSLSLGAREISKGGTKSSSSKGINIKPPSEKTKRVDEFLEEDFLAEYHPEENELEDYSQGDDISSQIDELSELLNNSLSLEVKQETGKSEQQNLAEVSGFLEEEFLEQYEMKDDDDDLELSAIDELSQMLENSLAQKDSSSNVSDANYQPESQSDILNNFFEEEFLEQHQIEGSGDDNSDFSNIEELSQLLESSLSFGIKKFDQIYPNNKSTTDQFNNFLEDDFLSQYGEESFSSDEEDISSEFADVDELSQLLESSLAPKVEKSNDPLDDTDEISRLFITENKDQKSQLSSASLRNLDELEDLLDETPMEKVAEESQIKPEISEVELYEEIDDLEEILEQLPTIESRELNGEVAQLEDLINGVVAIPLEIYEDIKELETLIDQPATLLVDNNSFNFEALMNLINAPATPEKTPSISPVKPSAKTKTVSLPIAPVVKEKFTAPSKEKEDDEFSDLEALLEKADNSMGGGKTSGISPRQSSQPKKANIFEQTMKVPVKQLDTLNNLMGELVVNRNSLEQDQERLRQFLDNLLNQVQQLSDVGGRMQDLYERSLLESSLLAARQGVRHGNNSYSYGGDNSNKGNSNSNDQDYDPLEMDRFTGFHLLSAEMIELIVRVRESASDIQFLVDETDQVARNLRQVSTQMSEGLTKTRMLPFSHTADRFSPGLYRIKRKLKKEAKLIIEGREVLIDKMIQEHLHDPMTHLINNAMTHGVETPEERKALGKNPEGTIIVRAFVQGNQTLITVSDDGAGINAAKVKAKAMEKKLITPQESAKLSKAEIYDFLFDAGFSTADKVGELSGRGVGLDVVRTSLNDIRGNVTIESKMGQGTTFTIRLPLTLSISKALCCLSDHSRIAFPMDGVEDMQDYLPSEIKTNPQGQKFILWRDSYLPFQSLSEFLSYNRHISRSSVYGKQASETISIVILRSAGKLLAVQVDQVLGEQEIVIKQIQGPIPKPPGIAGATVLGDGRIMPIADVLELIDISEGNLRRESGGHFLKTPDSKVIEEVKTQPIVLIVDDSITVRELLSISFNKAGYQVEQAKNGLEAWEKLISGLPCDIIFCDVEMPQMDGLELLSNINNDETLRDIPVAMLTSRGAEKHRKIAADLGASGYFTKPYLEEVLLDGAQKMMDGEVLLAHSTRKPKPKATPKPESAQDSSTLEKDLRQIHHPTVLQTSIREKPKVLIIDDSVTVRELLSMTFKNAGYLVEQAKDGEDAWQKLNDNPDIDLAFCDIEMPRLNGLDLLSRLQQDERLSKLPVAMLTSRGAQKMKNIAAERGAKGYFVKPYMEEVLLDAAERLFKGEVLLNVEEEEAQV
jgi:chemotaxis protein histidine kinase CheA/CheY-like chemotaxis protein